MASQVLHPPATGAPSGALERLTPYVPRVVMRHFGVPEPPKVVEVDATAVFVDVSGFTALSERLARKGREGAEHLTAAIGSCFEALLGTAYANGGSLLKFGGDALLLLFEDADHVERGVRAAWGMQETIAQVGRVDAGGAKVALRMSAGVHTGPYHLFFCGGSHRELVVAGPAASTVVRMEESAAAGQVVVSPATAERLPTRCLGHAVDVGRLLRRPPEGPPVAPVEPELHPSPVLVQGALSTEVRAHVEDGAQPPEHRTVGVAFLHADGVDELVRSDGHRAAGAALEALLACTQAAADDHGVCSLATDVTPAGVKVILTAGAPRSHEDDEERLLLALRRVVEAELPLRVRAGVHRGPVFAGDIGTSYRRTYTVMGDAVNLAARLMARAEPGEVIATPDVLERSRTRFACFELEPFRVKGKAEPVVALSVGPALGRRAQVRRDEGPLLGRTEELEALEAVLRGAREGRGRLVELVGEAGIGKSRLADETRRRAAGFRVVEARCEPYTASTPFALWRQVLRGLLGHAGLADDEAVAGDLRALVRSRAPDLEPWLPLLVVPLAVEVPQTREVAELAPEFRGAKLEEVVGELVTVLLDAPTLVAVEDAQHMDAASAQLLQALGAALAATPCVAVLTRRDGDGGFRVPDGPSTLRLAPGPLDPAQALELAEALTADDPLPPHLVALAADRSGGNPQLLHDLLREAAAGGGLPDSIETAATARIDRLAPTDRALLRRASVLGLSFDAQLLGVVLDPSQPPPDEDTWRRLAPLLEVDDGRLRFRRPVIREAAYAGLPFALRRRLHAAAAEHLEAHGGLEAAGVLSLHFLLAGRHERAWHAARLAGDRARDRFAPADAAYLYRRALEAARAARPPEAEVAAVWTDLADARVLTGEPQLAARSYTKARALTKDRVGRVRLMHKQAMLVLDTGGSVAAVRWVRRGLRELRDAEGDEARAAEASLIAALALIRQRQGLMDEAIRICREAVAAAEATGEKRALARALYVLDWALVESGHPRTEGHSERALGVLRELGDVRGESMVLSNMAGFAYRAGAWVEAIDLWEASAVAARRAGDAVGAAYADLGIAETMSDGGRFAEAEPRLRRAIQVLRGSGSTWAVAYGEVLLGRLHVRTDRHARGLEHLDAAEAAFTRLRAEQDVAWTRAVAAEAELARGSAGEAAAIAAGLLAAGAGGPRLVPLLERVVGIARVHDGRDDEGVAALHRALASAEEQEDVYEAAMCQAALAWAGCPGYDEAREATVQRLGIVWLPLLVPGDGQANALVR